MKVRKAVIPAAGLGTRVLPASKAVPKEMLPIVDKPAIQYIVEEAVAAGITDILIITNRGKVFNRQETLETLWKYDYTGDGRTVDVHIRRLREKIEHDTANPEFILTKWGVGYYFNDSD